VIRCGYNAQFRPPAPLVHVTIRSPDGTREAVDLPAQLDTGSDRTVIPADVVSALGIGQLDQVTVAGLGGNLLVIPTFLVQLEVRQLSPLMVEVATSPNEPLILLGRDVLNQFKILLDGPGLALEMG
jgi:predicted aspartyl protease